MVYYIKRRQREAMRDAPEFELWAVVGFLVVVCAAEIRMVRRLLRERRRLRRLLAEYMSLAARQGHAAKGKEREGAEDDPDMLNMQ